MDGADWDGKIRQVTKAVKKVQLMQQGTAAKEDALIQQLEHRVEGIGARVQSLELRLASGQARVQSTLDDILLRLVHAPPLAQQGLPPGARGHSNDLPQLRLAANPSTPEPDVSSPASAPPHGRQRVHDSPHTHDMPDPAVLRLASGESEHHASRRLRT